MRQPVTVATRGKRIAGVVLAVVGLLFAALVLVNPSSPSVSIFIPLMVVFVVVGAVFLVDIERSRRRSRSR